MNDALLRLGPLLLLLAPALARAGDAPVLGPLEAALLYHDASHTPAPRDRLVLWYGEVCGERDPAARAQAAAAAGATLRRAEIEAVSTERWTLPIRQTFGGYDARRGGFPTTLREGAVVTFGPSFYCGQDLRYLVAFANGGDYALLPLREDRALEFVQANPAREVVLELEVEVVSAQPGPPAPTLVVRIVRMRTLDATRRVLVADSGAGAG